MSVWNVGKDLLDREVGIEGADERRKGRFGNAVDTAAATRSIEIGPVHEEGPRMLGHLKKDHRSRRLADFEHHDTPGSNCRVDNRVADGYIHDHPRQAVRLAQLDDVVTAGVIDDDVRTLPEVGD